MVRGAATGDEEAGARGGDGVWAARYDVGAARDGVGGRATTATARRRGAAWRRRLGGEDKLDEEFHKC